MIKIRDAEMWKGLYSVSPILSQIGMRPQREGRKSSMEDEQGTIQQIDYKKQSVTIQRKLDDARGMTLEGYVETARELGIGMGKQMVQNLYLMIDRVTKETGNVVDARGRSFSSDIFLELVEKMLLDFTANGTPIWPTLTLGSKAHAEFQRLWPEWIKDLTFQTRLQAIVDRKREEFYERETCRRLVD
jgi:hypothetical protein